MRSTITAGMSSLGFGARQAFAAWPILMGRALFYIVCMTVLSALWDKVAAARLPGTLAATLPAGGLTLYVGVTEWITLSVAAVHLRLEDDIRSGALEPHLLRPKPYLVQKVAESIGGSFARLVAIGLAALLALALSGRAGPPPIAYVYVPILGAIGTAVGVLLFTVVGLSAFWIRRVLPPYLVVQKLMFLLGGLFAPISLYPGWLFRIAVATPFAANIYFAGAQTIAPSGEAFLRALGFELFWFAAIAAVAAALWQIGISRVLREGMP